MKAEVLMQLKLIARSKHKPLGERSQDNYDKMGVVFAKGIKNAKKIVV